MIKRTFVTVLALAALAAGPSAAQNYTTLGRLVCGSEGGTGLIVTSTKNLMCTFTPANGGPRAVYAGKIRKIGIDIGQFMGGVVVVEAVYGWPGIGQLAWQAIQQVDIPIIMGVTLTSALAIIIGNLVADFLAPVIDPRIRSN